MRALQLKIILAAALVWASGLAPVWAQFKESGDPEGAKAGKSENSRWQAGMTVKATGTACQGLVGYTPIPTDWPEQQVTVLEEDISPEAKIHYEMVDGGVKIMNVRIPQLAAGQEAKALVTLEIRRNAVIPPENTDNYVLPNVKKLSQQMRRYLLPSPKIEVKDSKIRDLAKKIPEDKEKAWDKVEAIYDWVRAHVKYENGPLKGAAAALRDGTGDCEELTSLFIAICRSANIPARTVWVPGHCYPEFYLEDEKGKGHWFPCQAAGAREFGGISELRPILQKGDSFRPPKNSKQRQRYMAEYLTGSGGGRPEVKFVRQPVK
jgi:hypothetical protein